MIELQNVLMELMNDSKMKMNKYVKYLIMMLAFVSCDGRKPASDANICLDFSKCVDDTLNVSDWMYPLEIVRLETTEESLLGSVDKLVEYNENYYVLDKKRNCVLVFDGTGNFLRRVGRVGQGPGEYSRLSDFIVDEKTGCLYLLANSSTVYAYDNEGSFLWKKKVSDSLLWNIGIDESDFVCSSNHLTYTSGKDAFLIYRFNEDFQEKDRSVEVFKEQLYSPLLISNPFQKWNGNSYYIDAFFNIVYSLSDEKVIPYCEFKFTSPIPVEYFSNAGLLMEHQRRYDFVKEAFFSKEYLWVSYIHSGKHRTAIVEMASREIIGNGETRGMFPKVYQSGESLLSPISTEDYLRFWTHLDGMLKQPVSIEDNHLILKWKIKE